ncbi:MAG TPA: class I SAM-dependent methyltransferase [Acidimicrobiales bacterium]
MPDYNRPNAKCPTCFSEERHRALRVFLGGWLSNLDRPLRVLHQAPDAALRPWLEAQAGVTYITGDLAELPVMIRFDLQQIPFRTASLDVVIASHVLEHVADDRAAMKEILRVLQPGGSAILMVPIDGSREHTYEDPSLTTAAQRAAAYWQFDHVRLYGRDFADRLSDVGLNVRMEQPSRLLPPDLVLRYGLSADPSVYAQLPIAPPDEVYIATRPPNLASRESTEHGVVDSSQDVSSS